MQVRDDIVKQSFSPPLWFENVTIIIECITTKFDTNIQGPYRTKNNDFGDFLTFALEPKECQSVDFCSGIYYIGLAQNVVQTFIFFRL